MKLIIIILLSGLVLLFPHEIRAQIGNKKLDDYFTRKIQKAQIIGLQVASVGNGELVWHGSYGVKEMNTANAVNDSTLFMIASCSKPVTALGIMKLYDQGNINLDDDINDYLPFNIINPNYPEEKITIRMLLTHTSSLRDDWDILWPTYTLRIQVVIRVLKRLFHLIPSVKPALSFLSILQPLLSKLKGYITK